VATSSEERLAVLRLLQEGKITPQEAAKLLEALETPVAVASTAPKASWLHIRITDLTTQKVRVNVTLPATMVRAGLKLGSRFGSELEGLDPELLATFLAQGEPGVLIDMVDEKDRERIEVFLD